MSTLSREAPASPPLHPPTRLEPALVRNYTAAELDAIVALLAQARARAITIGHGRELACQEAAAAFVDAWSACGGQIVTIVDWPEQAASWLRTARRFTAEAPDAWVVAAPALGWAQMARRLRASTGWEPERTFGFAALGTPEAVRLAGRGVLDGMRGASADGGTWRAGPIAVTEYPPITQGTGR